MRQSLLQNFAVLAGILLIVLFVYTVDIKTSTITSYSTTSNVQVALTIVDDLHDQNDNESEFEDNMFHVLENRRVNSGVNFTVKFAVTGSKNSSLNMSYRTTNPEPSNNFTGKKSLSKFVIIRSNFTFNNVTITETYVDGEINASINESSLRIYHFINATGNWSVLPGSVDTASNIVSGVTTTFSTFGVFGDAPSAGGGGDDGGGGGGAPSGGGGGGGTTAAAPADKPSFSITPAEISTTLVQGGKETYYLLIENGNVKADFFIRAKNMERFILLSDTEFTLDPGESRLLRLDLSIALDEDSGVFPMQLEVIATSAGGIYEKVISTVIAVESENPLFDAIIKILLRYKLVAPGDILYASILLQNIGSPQNPVDVEMTINVLNYENKVIESTKETVAVEEELSLIREFQLPADLPPDEYIITIEAHYANTAATAFDKFTVSKEAAPLLRIPGVSRGVSILFILLMSVASLITAGSIIFASWWYLRKMRRHRKEQPHTPQPTLRTSGLGQRVVQKPLREITKPLPGQRPSRVSKELAADIRELQRVLGGK